MAVIATGVIAIGAAAIFITRRQWFFAETASSELSEVRKHPFPVWILGIEFDSVLPLLIMEIFFFTGDRAVARVVWRGRG